MAAHIAAPSARSISMHLVHCVCCNLQAELGELPEQVVPPACCAEFLVSRERVLQRPLSFYRNALDVLQVMIHTCSVLGYHHDTESSAVAILTA